MIDKNSKDPDKDEFHMRFLFFLFSSLENSRNISSPKMFSTRRTPTQLLYKCAKINRFPRQPNLIGIED